jgi:hypothetical protein
MWNVKAEVITINNRGDWNHFKITQTIPEPHSRKAQNKGTAKNSHIGHCKHTMESANVKGKGHPITGHEGPRGVVESVVYNFTDLTR